MKLKILLAILMLIIGIPSFAQITPSAVITGNAVTIIGPGGTIYPVALSAQLTGCGPEVPVVPGGGSVVTNFYKVAAPSPNYSATITAYGNDVIVCGTQSYTTYAVTWLINNQPAAPTATYRVNQGATCNISDGSCKPIGFVPPVIARGAGLFCAAGQQLMGFNADYTPNCIGFTGNPLPPFLTNGITNANQTALNLTAINGLSATNSGSTVTFNASALTRLAPTASQTIAQPSGTNLNVVTSGGGQLQYNGIEVATTASLTGQFVLKNPTGSQSIAQIPGTTLSVSNLNRIINPFFYGGPDIGAAINAAAASVDCTNGCTISVPQANYTQTTAATITGANIRLIGNGSNVTIGAVFTASITINGDNDEVSGFNFSTIGTSYGVIASKGINQRIIGNNFSGPSVSYIAISGSPSGMLVDRNSFNGSNGCSFQDDVSVFYSSHVNVANNNSLNPCGFSIEISASKQTNVQNNAILQDTQIRSITATASQTNFVFNWPAGKPQISRVWIEVNGLPTTATNVVYTSALVTTVTMPPQSAGAVVTALGWSGLESIQANSQAFDTIISGNTVTGSGDAGIDIVSDYHIIPNGSLTATANQSVFVISASPGITTQALPFLNGRILTPNEASITNIGSSYTITLTNPAIAGSVVMLGDWTINLSGTVASDYPSGVTVQGNVVKDIASSCLANLIGASGISFQGNVLEDCGLGVATTALSSGIFTGNAVQLSVKNNVINNTRPIPSMTAGISVQCAACETGNMEKPVVISGNTYTGSFSNGTLYIPGLNPRQGGIDVQEGSTLNYPGQINFDRPWSTSPPNDHYFSWTCAGGGLIRDTTTLIGGVASARTTSGGLCDINPTNQIFFYDGIAKVTFWAKQVSGTPRVVLFSLLATNSGAIAVNVTSNQWRQYSIYLPTTGLDNPAGILFRVDGSTGVMNIQNIAFQVTPVGSHSTPGVGSTSATNQNLYTDSLSIGTLSGSGNALACLDAAGNAYRGTATTCP